MTLYEKQINTNHSCNPNAVKATVTSWDSNETGPGDTMVKAIKDIPENTEVTINYLSHATVIGSRAERQKELLCWSTADLAVSARFARCPVMTWLKMKKFA